MRRAFAFLFIWFVCALGSYAQSVVLMGAQQSVTNCNIIIYDDGGLNGNYASNVNETLTILSNDPNNGCVMVEITDLDIDTTDTLTIYDGVGTTGPVLHKINNSNYDVTGTFRYAATIQNNTGAITLQFTSDASGVGTGFEIRTSCIAPCQRITLEIDSANCSHLPRLDPDDGYYYIDLCPYDTLHFSVNGVYPDNDFSYHQSDNQTTFLWDFDLEEIDSIGGHSVDYYFTPGRGYDVSISAADQTQCLSLIPITFRVRTSKNPIRNTSPLPTVCSGQRLDLTVGYDQISYLQLDSVGSEQITSLGVLDTVFLPDGISCPPYGYYYRSYVNFTSFAPTATITNANDILFVRIKMEHSAIEDIRIKLFCPNGSSCRIVPDYQNDGWGGITHNFRTNLGRANRLQEVTSCNPAQNPMGEAWNYVWSNNTTLGYQYANGTYGYCYEPVNVHYIYNPMWDDGTYSYVIDSSNVANMTQIYHPNESFAGMVGCPLNGNWYIEIQDLWTNDNGYLHEWEIALDPRLLPQNWSYTVNIDTTYLVGPGANCMYVIPDQDGDIPYTAVVVDEFGCAYDTVVPLHVVRSPKPELGEDFNTCYGDRTIIASHYDAPNTEYFWNTGDNTPDIEVVSSGDYSVFIATTDTTFNLTCYGSDTIHMEVLEVPHADFTLNDTSGCTPATIRMTDLTTADNPDYQYEWSILREDGSLAYASPNKNPVFTIEEPGTYSVYLRVSTPEGCADSLYKWNCLHIYHKPIAEFASSPEISLFQESGGTIHFHNYADSTMLGDGGLGFVWDFGDGTTDSSNFSPDHTYASWGDYDVTLTMSSQQNCSSQITHTVVIEDDLIFPNIITPNGDNVNDCFAIQNLNTNYNPEDPDQFRSNELFIYDRWGKSVYHAKNYDTYSIDGNITKGSQYFDASNLSDGVYYYSFYYKGKVKTVDYHGSITVIR
ncbi:MAG: gliding motility-associated C-terminal domain-containing protein [Bacteroidales bacterium]|nr:gliding motility-associated C-terminal domain-containing protein [Bacteroidales bacterium]